MTRRTASLFGAVATVCTAVAVAGTAGAADGPQPPPGTTAPGGACPVTGDAYDGAGDLFALTRDGRLIRLDGSRFQPERTVQITGVPAGVSLLGLDTRPANGQLYAVGTDARVYVLDPATGQVTSVTTTPGVPSELSDADFGVDFNPVVDRIRVVSANRDNVRLDPTLGTIVAYDTQLAYRPGDRYAGTAPEVTAAAYSNSVAGATSTVLYGIDTDTDSLVIQGNGPDQPTESPNLGRLSTVGPLGVAVERVTGFDIVGTTAYAALRPTTGTRTTLVRIDLATGRATQLTGLPDGVVGLTGSAGAPVAAYAVTSTNALFSVSRRSPGQASAPLGIAGMQPGETVVGMDVRPATGQLFALGSTSRIYVLTPATAQATLVGQLAAELGTVVGFDVNPTVDRIRVVTSTGRNLRVNPNTGAIGNEDTALSSSGVSGAAYTNSQVGATSTTLYDLNTAADTLVVQNPPNAGTLTRVGALGIDASDRNGFDIAADGAAVAALQVGSASSSLYCVDLGTGRATLAGRIGSGVVVTALAVAPRGVPFRTN